MDLLLLANDYSVIYYLGITLVCIGVMGIIVAYGCNILMAQLEKQVGYEISASIICHYQHISYNFHAQKKLDAAYLNERIYKDSSSIVSFFLGNYLHFFIYGIELFSILWIFYSISTTLVYISMLFILLYIASFALLRKPLLLHTREIKEQQSQIINSMFLQLAKLKQIKIDASFEYNKSYLKNSFSSFLESVTSFSRISYLYSSFDGIINILFQCCIIIWGGVQVIDRKMSIGQYSILITYFTYLSVCIKYYFGLGQSIQEAKTSFERISEILSIPKEKNGKNVIEKIENIRVASLSFSYVEGQRLLRDIDLDFCSNNVYLLYGRNGAGKTTLTELLIGLLRCDDGHIFYNGFDINSLDMYKMREQNISVVSQAEISSEITVSEYFREAGFSLTHIQNVAQELGIIHFYNNEAIELEAIWSRKMASLSSGEQQKLKLLCAISKNTADFIIFDEPVNGLDLQSEEDFMNIIDKVRINKIIIIISHNKNHIHEYLNTICL